MPAYLLLWLPLLGYYALGFLGLAYDPLYEFSLKALNSGIERNPSESALIEHLEALFWLIGFALYLSTAIRLKLQRKRYIWCIAFALLCLLALGEETSWGQHYLQFTPPDSVLKINAQGELNLHNLHLEKTFGLSPDNPLNQRFGSLTGLLNPAFYALCIFIWLLFPIFLERTDHARITPFFRGYPRQNGYFYYSYAFFIGLFVIVDNLIFDVGELFELTVATVGAMTGMIQFGTQAGYQE